MSKNLSDEVKQEMVKILMHNVDNLSKEELKAVTVSTMIEMFLITRSDKDEEEKKSEEYIKNMLELVNRTAELTVIAKKG